MMTKSKSQRGHGRRGHEKEAAKILDREEKQSYSGVEKRKKEGEGVAVVEGEREGCRCWSRGRKAGGQADIELYISIS